MSLEPVILNEVQRKAAETQIKIDTQTQAVIAEIAAKADEINVHVSGASSGVASHITQETDRTLSAIDSQATAITAAVEVSRDEVNSTTQTAKNDVKSHVTSEANRVIAAAQSGGDKYGHEEIIGAVNLTGRTVTLSSPFIITPPSPDSFIRITVLETNSGIGQKIDLGRGVFNFRITDRGQSNNYLFGVNNSFRVGGRAYSNSASLVASDAMNPLQHLDGALGLPVKIYGYSDSNNSVVYVAYQIIRVR
ncbi:hypothetical protein VCSRO93_2851 [Vibrio cholerae]|nr:hypothetical protein VCSRO93_2851 [Vibrio cholerae]